MCVQCIYILPRIFYATTRILFDMHTVSKSNSFNISSNAGVTDDLTPFALFLFRKVVLHVNIFDYTNTNSCCYKCEEYDK